MSSSQRLTTALSDAIKAHAGWKMRLRKAAMRKDRDLPVDTICRDDCCDFGKWLNRLPSNLQSTPEAQKVRQLHTQFHIQAGRVAKQISDAQFDQALQSLETGGYVSTSKDLTRAVAAWKLKVLVGTAA